MAETSQCLRFNYVGVKTFFVPYLTKWEEEEINYREVETMFHHPLCANIDSVVVNLCVGGGGVGVGQGYEISV